MNPGPGLPPGWVGPNPSFMPRTMIRAYPEAGYGVKAWWYVVKQTLKHPHMQHLAAAMAFTTVLGLAIHITDDMREKSMTLNRDNIMEQRRIKHAPILQDMGFSGEWGPIKIHQKSASSSSTTPSHH